MAYPFTIMPTLRRFLDRAKSAYGAEIVKIDGISGPRGKAEIFALVRKTKEGKKVFAIIPDLKDNEFLVPTQLRSLCVQLEIPLNEFDLNLG